MPPSYAHMNRVAVEYLGSFLANFSPNFINMKANQNWNFNDNYTKKTSRLTAGTGIYPPPLQQRDEKKLFKYRVGGGHAKKEVSFGHSITIFSGQAT